MNLCCLREKKRKGIEVLVDWLQSLTSLIHNILVASLVLMAQKEVDFYKKKKK